MNVKLLAHTPEPEKVIAFAAKLCYSNAAIDELRQKIDDPKVREDFIEMLSSLGHESPFEHITFTFGIEGISRACSHQLVRHRIASYSQKSQRYVSEGQFDYITPDVIEDNMEAKLLFEDCMMYCQESYDKIRKILIDQYVKNGMSVKDATKKANEDARFVLPNACETKIIVTMNARALFNFFKERCCNRAQWEIRAMANEMLRQCREVAPTIFRHAGPECITKGKCPEGKMSCGHPPKFDK